jgi:hypothetical protein
MVWRRGGNLMLTAVSSPTSYQTALPRDVLV